MWVSQEVLGLAAIMWDDEPFYMSATLPPVGTVGLVGTTVSSNSVFIVAMFDEAEQEECPKNWVVA